MVGGGRQIRVVDLFAGVGHQPLEHGDRGHRRGELSDGEAAHIRRCPQLHCSLDDLGHFVRNSAFDQISRPHADDVVEPRVLLRAGFEKRIRPEVIVSGVDLVPFDGVGLGGAQFGRGDPAAAVSHVHERVVVRAQCQPDIQGHRPVRTQQRPVAASRQHFPMQLRTIERTTGTAEQGSPAEWATADVQPGIEIDNNVEEMRRLDLADRLEPRVGSHWSSPLIVLLLDTSELVFLVLPPAVSYSESAAETATSPKSFRRTASVETPDWAHSADRSKKNRSPAMRSSLKVNWMNTGSSAGLPFGTTPNRSPVKVIRAVPQQINVSSLLACPCRTTL